jgi:ADP-ribose pyrophosphatase
VTAPGVLAREIEYASPWLEVVAKEVDLGPPRGRETFWSVRTAHDYAAVLALTEDGRIPLVRQFRPAVERDVLELPSGAVEPGEEPEAAIRRELLEETGCEAGEIVLLGRLHTDSGRMETVQWAFFAPDARVVRDGPVGDEQLELLFVERDRLRDLVVEGEFRLAPHLAVLATALLRGYVQL